MDDRVQDWLRALERRVAALESLASPSPVASTDVPPVGLDSGGEGRRSTVSEWRAWWRAQPAKVVASLAFTLPKVAGPWVSETPTSPRAVRRRLPEGSSVEYAGKVWRKGGMWLMGKPVHGYDTAEAAMAAVDEVLRREGWLLVDDIGVNDLAPVPAPSPRAPAAEEAPRPERRCACGAGPLPLPGQTQCADCIDRAYRAAPRPLTEAERIECWSYAGKRPAHAPERARPRMVPHAGEGERRRVRRVRRARGGAPHPERRRSAP